MKKSISVKRTAHYHIQEGFGSKNVVYVVHGYGQLAQDFIEEFSYLKNENAVVIAPEALSKFYNKERKAVANWMTSHERDDEIKDYINFLNDVHREVQKEYQANNYFILGYSQGVSTTLRWMASSDCSFKAAYLCSGSIPPELKPSDLQKNANCKFNYYYGDSDSLLAIPKAKEQFDKLLQLNQNSEAIQFEGGHILSEACKKQIKKDFS